MATPVERIRKSTQNLIRKTINVTHICGRSVRSIPNTPIQYSTTLSFVIRMKRNTSNIEIA